VRENLELLVLGKGLVVYHSLLEEPRSVLELYGRALVPLVAPFAVLEVTVPRRQYLGFYFVCHNTTSLQQIR